MLTIYVIAGIISTLTLGVLVSNTAPSVLDGFQLFYEELASFPRPLRRIRRSRQAK